MRTCKSEPRADAYGELVQAARAVLVVVEPDAKDRAVPQGHLDPAARLVPDGSRRKEVAADQEQVPPEDVDGADLVGAGLGPTCAPPLSVKWPAKLTTVPGNDRSKSNCRLSRDAAAPEV